MNRTIVTVLAAAAVIGLSAAVPAHAIPSITVAPGASPAGGYLPLSLFGGITTIAGMGDDTQFHFNVSNFKFGGNTYNELNVDSNGYVVVGGPAQASNPINQFLPDPVLPNNVLALYWADLDPSAAGAVRIGELTDGVTTWIVVDWQAVRVKETGGATSFEIWLQIGANEDITYAYGPQGVTPADLTVGAEDFTGTIGDNFYHNGTGTAPTNGMQLRVTATDLTTAPEPGTLSVLGLSLAGLGYLRRRKAARA